MTCWQRGNEGLPIKNSFPGYKTQVKDPTPAERHRGPPLRGRRGREAVALRCKLLLQSVLWPRWHPRALVPWLGSWEVVALQCKLLLQSVLWPRLILEALCRGWGDGRLRVSRSIPSCDRPRRPWGEKPGQQLPLSPQQTPDGFHRWEPHSYHAKRVHSGQC